MLKLRRGLSLALLTLLGVGLLLGACGDNTPTTNAPTAVAATTTAVATTTAASTTASTTTAVATSLAATTTAANATTAAAATSANNAAKGKVVVSSKNITESILIGEMYAAVLEQAGIPVERKMNLGTVQITHQAITKGDISLYPEYTGTAFLNVLKLPKESNDPKVIYDKVATEYARQFQLTVLDPGQFNDTIALVASKAAADKYKLKTLSDLAPLAKDLRFACVATFTGTRSETDGLKSLQRTYGGFEFKDIKIFELNLKYKALIAGDADIAQANSTDGDINGYGFVLLQDDKNNFPPYQVMPVVRDDVLAAYPNIKPLLNSISARLTTEKMTALNWKVDGPEKQEAADVAKDFLKKEGLLK